MTEPTCFFYCAFAKRGTNDHYHYGIAKTYDKPSDPDFLLRIKKEIGSFFNPSLEDGQDFVLLTLTRLN